LNFGGGVGDGDLFQNFPTKITRYQGRGKNTILSVKTYVFIISLGLSVKLQSILEDNVIPILIQNTNGNLHRQWGGILQTFKWKGLISRPFTPYPFVYICTILIEMAPLLSTLHCKRVNVPL